MARRRKQQGTSRRSVPNRGLLTRRKKRGSRSTNTANLGIRTSLFAEGGNYTLSKVSATYTQVDKKSYKKTSPKKSSKKSTRGGRRNGS